MPTPLLGYLSWLKHSRTAASVRIMLSMLGSVMTWRQARRRASTQAEKAAIIAAQMGWQIKKGRQRITWMMTQDIRALKMNTNRILIPLCTTSESLVLAHVSTYLHALNANALLLLQNWSNFGRHHRLLLALHQISRQSLNAFDRGCFIHDAVVSHTAS